MAGGFEQPECGEGPFDGAKPDWTCADGRQKCRQHGCGGFVAPVAEEAGEADAEDRAVEPELFLGSIRHEESLQWTLQFTVRERETKLLALPATFWPRGRG